MMELEDLLQRPNVSKDAVQSSVQKIMATRVLSDMIHVVELLCNEKVLLSVSKEVMKVVAGAMEQFDNLEEMSQFEQKIRECTSSRSSAYEDALAVVYDTASKKYEASGRKKEAAEELVRLYDCINDSHGVDRSATLKSAEYLRRRVRLCVKAATLLTEVNEIESANHLLQRVSDKVSELQPTDDCVLEYKVLYANLFDLRHDFIRASQKYIELVRNSALPPEKKFECLRKCAICLCLSDAGPERSAVLTIMFKDDRTPELDCYPFLKKIQQQHILRPAEVDRFKDMLLPHQKTSLSGEAMTPLDRAVMLHNLFSAANIYTSIRLDDLALLLRIDKKEAEKTASDMIRQKRIKAKIDQIKDMLFFNNQHDSLVAWDSHVDSMCTAADEAAAEINRVKEEDGKMSDS